MPEMDGRRPSAEAAAAASAAAVIIVTGYSSEVERDSGGQPGVVGYLSSRSGSHILSAAKALGED
jgi:DNA-binding NarL/FixJ family response regulator